MEKLTAANKRKFYKRVLMLGLPMVVQQFLSSLINLLDTFMLGSVSEDVLTAAGLANKLFFVFYLVVYGITTGAAIFIAQFYGKGDNKNAQKYLGISIILSSIVGIVFSCVAFIIPHKIMALYSNSETVIAYGVQYLRILLFSYVFTAISACFYTALKSTHHVYIPLVFTIGTLFVNLSLNFVFIFILKYGIKGAAWATLIARAVEFFTLIFVIKIKNTALKSPFRDFFRLSKQDFKKYFKVAGFVIFTEVVWSVGTALYAVAYKKFGTSAQAAIQVTDTCTMVFIVAAFALGNSAAVIIGNTIGEGNVNLAQIYAKKFYFISIVAGVVIGLIVMAFSPILPNIFPRLTQEGNELARRCLLIMGTIMPIRCLEFMLMIGILRSGGDTRYAIACEILSVWALALPIIILASYVFDFPFIFVFLLTYSEMLFKCIFGTWRLFRGKKWLHNVTNTKESSPNNESVIDTAN